jgi:hypothetical protein
MIVDCVSFCWDSFALVLGSCKERKTNSNLCLILQVGFSR